MPILIPSAVSLLDAQHIQRQPMQTVRLCPTSVPLMGQSVLTLDSAVSTLLNWIVKPTSAKEEVVNVYGMPLLLLSVETKSARKLM